MKNRIIETEIYNALKENSRLITILSEMMEEEENEKSDYKKEIEQLEDMVDGLREEVHDLGSEVADLEEDKVDLENEIIELKEILDLNNK